LNVPRVDFDKFKVVYKALQTAIENGLLASCHAVTRGGLGVHLSYMAMAGGLGLDVDLAKVPVDESRGGLLNETRLFSESAGRFIVTLPENNRPVFDKLFKGMAAACIGRVTDAEMGLKIQGLDGNAMIRLGIPQLETAFNKTFGEMI
jgi:phosphoribosylformylglycinamidine synthase